jgi:hypothetical protein
MIERKRSSVEFRDAAKNGNTDIVKLFLKDKNLNVNDLSSYAFCHSSENGHFDIVQLLINDKRTNVTARSNYPIRKAFSAQKHNVVQLLWKIKRIRDTLKVSDNVLYNILLKESMKNKINGFS